MELLLACWSDQAFLLKSVAGRKFALLRKTPGNFREGISRIKLVQVAGGVRRKIK